MILWTALAISPSVVLPQKPSLERWCCHCCCLCFAPRHSSKWPSGSRVLGVGSRVSTPHHVSPPSSHSFHLSIYPSSIHPCIHTNISTIFAMSGGSQKCAHLWFARQKVWRIYESAASFFAVCVCVCKLGWAGVYLCLLVNLSFSFSFISFFFRPLATHLCRPLVAFVVCLCVKLRSLCLLASAAC